jgi:hypothetical protein
VHLEPADAVELNPGARQRVVHGGAHVPHDIGLVGLVVRGCGCGPVECPWRANISPNALATCGEIGEVGTFRVRLRAKSLG